MDTTGEAFRGRALDGLDALLAEAASARAVRSLARCLEAVEEALVESDGVPLDCVAPVARSLAGLEELTARPVADGADVAPILERIATSQLIASARLSLLRTSLPALPSSARGARCMVAVVRELLHAVESVAPADGDGQEMSLTAAVTEDFVTFVGSSRTGANPVSSVSGADAFARLSRLAAAVGGTVRREMDGRGAIRIGVALGVSALAT